MPFGLTPYSLDGTDLQASPYTSYFNAGDDPLSTVTHEPIETEIAGDYPEVVRQQPGGKTFPLHILLSPLTEANLAALKKLADPDKGAIILKATDGTPVTRRLTVYVVDLRIMAEEEAPHHVAVLYAPRPVWEQDSQQSDVQTISASPATWPVTNAGTKRAYPVIQLKPTVAKAHTADYLRRWPVSIASRTELEMLSTDGLPYPIDVANDALDTDAENTAGRLQSDLDDLRVLVNGTEVRRDCDPAADNATTKLWCSIPFKPMLRATAAAAMTLISPANGESFSVSDPGGLNLWPESGFVLVDSECLYYGARSDTAFQQVLRGSRGTTVATHSAAAYLYRVQHDIQIISDYTAATEPNGSDVDRKPIIDLALSTNLKHVRAGPFTAIGTYRSGQMVRLHTNDNLLSPAISFLDGATPAFRDIAPSAAAPKFNNLELYVPCGIKAAAGAIKHDVVVEPIMRLDVLGVDSEGLESLLAWYHPENDGAALTLQPGSVLSRLCYRANSACGLGSAFISDVGVTWYIAVGTAALNMVSQGFVLSHPLSIRAIALRIYKTGAAPNGYLYLDIYTDASGDPGAFIARVESMLASDLPSAVDWVLFRQSQTETICLPAGTYHLRLERSVATGDAVWLQASMRTYPLGFKKMWNGGSWDDEPDCVWNAFAVLSNPEEQYEDQTLSGSGQEATIDNPEYTFDDATPRTPLIVRGAQETIYFLRGVLKNDDTGQEITVACPMALTDILELDPYNKTVKRIPASAADPTEDVPWACVFSDEIEWLTLLAGVSNLRYTEANMGTVVATLTWRGAWA